MALLSSYQMPAPAPVSPVPAAPYRNIVLPSCYVEGRFYLHGVLDEQNHFDLLVKALPKESSSLVVDVMENPPPTYQYLYSTLKQPLLASHRLPEDRQAAQDGAPGRQAPL